MGNTMKSDNVGELNTERTETAFVQLWIDMKTVQNVNRR